jgi:D-xylose transport system permease protein
MTTNLSGDPEARGEVVDTAPESAAAADVVDPRLLVREQGLRGYWTLFLRRVRGGELGALPVVVGLAVIWTVFQVQNDRFLSAQNLTNLALQIVPVGTISVGIVLVLLLGEIDLSVGSVSGLCGAILAVLYINHGFNPWVAIAVAVLAGAGVGLLQGFFITRFGVPSFIVTLSGLIAWQGLQLYVLGKTGSINIPFDGGVAKLSNTFLSDAVAYVVVAVVIGLYLAAALAQDRRRTAAGLTARPFTETVVRAALLAVALLAGVYVMNRDRGVPVSLLIFVGLVVVFDLITRRTTYGRHIFAVGGNPEAARRAGINVDRIKITVFILCSAMAAFGGVLGASRLLAVNQQSGGGDVLLNAIAAAVIGGTSLFGGRGSTYSALLGILVIGSISNGMDLLGLESSIKFMITGGVLLAAVILDSVARRGRQATGRA